MPYSVAEFDESRQESFIETVADAANVPSFRVEITSITEATGRRLLAQGCEVLFRVRMPRGEEEERAPVILEALSAVENMNARLEQRGLQPALRVVGPAHTITTAHQKDGDRHRGTPILNHRLGKGAYGAKVFRGAPTQPQQASAARLDIAT